MEIIINFINNICETLFNSDMETFWTAFGSIVGAFVLGFSVYQLRVQNKRQNELDERQNNIEEREKYQIELNIKQSLFERRVSSWNILSGLLSSIEEMSGASHKFGINPLLMYIGLTNNYYLESIQEALGGINLANREWRTNPKVQNEFLKKLSEMDNFSKEIMLLFSGNEIEELKKFVTVYRNLLKKLYANQLVVDSVRQESINYGQNFDNLSVSNKLEERGKKVVEEFESLKDVACEIKTKDLMKQLFNEIKFTA